MFKINHLKKIYFLTFVLFFVSCKKKVIYNYSIINDSIDTLIVNSDDSKIYFLLAPEEKKQMLDTTLTNNYNHHDLTIFNKKVTDDLIILKKNGDSIKKNIFNINHWKLKINSNNIFPKYEYYFFITKNDFN